MLNRFEHRVARVLPPGWPVRTELRFFVGGLIAAVLWSFSCLVRIGKARSMLYFRTAAGTLALRRELNVPPFEAMIEGALWGFWLLAFALLGFVLMHYLYYWRDSKSIYLMRRLPDKSLWHRCCLTVPFWMILTVLAVGFALMGLYNLIYKAAVLPEWVLKDFVQTASLVGSV